MKVIRSKFLHPNLPMSPGLADSHDIPGILIHFLQSPGFFLSYSSIWAEEIARYAFIYIAYIGASAAIKERAHIRIDVILNVLPNRMKLILYIFGDIVTLILAVVSIYMSMESVLVSLHFDSVTHGLRVSQAWFLAAVPIGFSMMVVRILQSLWRDWNDLRANRPVFEGNPLFD